MGIFFFWPIAGGLLAYIYISSGYDIKGWLAFTTGLTVPTTIQSIIDKGTASKIPLGDIGEVDIIEEDE